jgi:hypothetical protein
MGTAVTWLQFLAKICTDRLSRSIVIVKNSISTISEGFQFTSHRISVEMLFHSLSLWDELLMCSFSSVKKILP